MTVADCVNWPMSPPSVPALVCNAPPIVPGTPTSVSSPASPSRTAVEIAWPSFAPPPAVSLRPATSMAANAAAPSATTSPGTPSSRTSRFDPPTEHTHGHTVFVAAADESRKLFDGGWLGEVLSRSAQAKPRIGRERLVLADDVLETGRDWHGGCRACAWQVGDRSILTLTSEGVSIAIFRRNLGLGIDVARNLATFDDTDRTGP